MSPALLCTALGLKLPQGCGCRGRRGCLLHRTGQLICGNELPPARQYCDHITSSCFDSVLPPKPQGSASLPKQCSDLVLAPTAAVSKYATHSLGLQGEHYHLYPHSHVGSFQKSFRAFKVPFIIQMFLWRLPSHSIIGCKKLLAISTFR